jgi:hypothetical protein
MRGRGPASLSLDEEASRESELVEALPPDRVLVFLSSVSPSLRKRGAGSVSPSPRKRGAECRARPIMAAVFPAAKDTLAVLSGATLTGSGSRDRGQLRGIRYARVLGRQDQERGDGRAALSE